MPDHPQIVTFLSFCFEDSLKRKKIYFQLVSMKISTQRNIFTGSFIFIFGAKLKMLSLFLYFGGLMGGSEYQHESKHFSASVFPDCFPGLRLYPGLYDCNLPCTFICLLTSIPLRSPNGAVKKRKMKLLRLFLHL